jgi:hypothetical protein
MANLQKGFTDYMTGALDVLRKFEIIPKEEDTRFVELLNEVQDVDEPKVLAIAGIVKYMGAFNELVRNNVDHMNSATRYEQITELFASIKDDAKKMVEQTSDGKIDLGEKVDRAFMTLTRGNIHQRFDRLTHVYNEVSKDTHTQLEKEDTIQEAYTNFRMSVQQASILATELFETETGRKTAAKDRMNIR